MMHSRYTRLILLVFFVSFPGALLADGTAVHESTTGYRYSELPLGVLLEHWLVTGPFPFTTTGDGAAEEAFHHDYLTDDGGESGSVRDMGTTFMWSGSPYAWSGLNSWSGWADLNKFFGGEQDNSVAYAWVEFNSVESRNVAMFLRSDDGVRAWLNGRLVHDHLVWRAYDWERDVVPVTVRQGRNHLLLKILNGYKGWEFGCAILDRREALAMIVSAGETAGADTLLRAGEDVNVRAADGRAPLHCAAEEGSTVMLDWLVSRGAQLEVRARSGLNALDLARRAEQPAAVAWLKARGLAPTPHPRPASVQVDDLLAELTRGRRPGVAVAVVQGGRVVHLKAYGRSDAERGPRMTTATPVMLDSLTKTFIAATALRLAEKGSLRLADPVRTWLPELPAYMDAVTVRHLLCHQSGIPHEMVDPDDLGNAYSSWPDFLAYLRSRSPFDRVPGAKFEYSSIGYVLLQLVCERAAGEPIGDLARSLVFSPAGMTTASIADTRGLGFTLTRPGGAASVAAPPDRHRHAFRNRANGKASVEDLARWAVAVERREVLSPSTWNEATSPARTKDGAITVYGYGWFTMKQGERTWFYHDGIGLGPGSMFLHYPAEHLSIAVLSTDADRYSARTIGYRIASMYLSHPD